MEEDQQMKRRLQRSESMRAELVVENHHLKEEVEALRVYSSPSRNQSLGVASSSPFQRPSSGFARSASRDIPKGTTTDGEAFDSPSHLDAAVRISQLETELALRDTQVMELSQRRQQHGVDAPPTKQTAIGQISVVPLPQPSEHDYGFVEENHAKQCAEDIMARLLRALHAQRDAQERLSAVQLENVRLQSLLDESRGREVVLSQIVSAYSDVVNAPSSSAHGEVGSSSTTSRSGALGSLHGGHPPSASQVEVLLQQCMSNLARLDGVKRRLIDEKLKETTEENEKLRAAMSNKTIPNAGGMGARSDGTRLTAATPSNPSAGGCISSHNGGSLLSDERTLLVTLMEREKDYEHRMQLLKQMIIEREKTIHDMRKLMEAQVKSHVTAGGSSPFSRHAPAAATASTARLR